MGPLVALGIALTIALGTTALFVYGAWQLVCPRKRVREASEDAVSVFAPSKGTSSTEHGSVASSTENMPSLRHDLKTSLGTAFRGDLCDDDVTLNRMSRDTSVFMRRPKLVAYPKDANDVAALVTEVARLKETGNDISITARSAGTDMSGGPLGTSVIAVFTKYMNVLREIREDAAGGYAVVEPGMFYRDFEKETLAHGDLMLQSYPASRELAAIGGIVNNNAGGERTLEYGKTERYVEEVEVVLSDGTETTFKALSPEALEVKKKLPGLEGRIYRQMDELLITHADAIARAKPGVSKNSAGYALWNIKDKATKTFNLAKLVCGAQGTLALMTAAKLRLVKDQGNRSMVVAFLNKKDLAKLPEIVHAVLPHNPESFESFDEHTLSLAIKFLPGMLRQMGIGRAIRLGFSFLPEAGLVATGGAPALILMAEFSEDTHEEALAAARAAQASLAPFGLRTRVLEDEQASEKYWIVRRESFALLRKHSKGLYAAPFIDDLVVPPEAYTNFLPELNALLAEYQRYFIYTIAGHIGNGNFHIIPLMDLSKPEVRKVITELSPRVYHLVKKYGGSTTGEHNDGIIRTPYLEEFFGAQVNDLFIKTKEIFDPHNIFNPGKKVGGTFKDIEDSIITSTS